MVHHLDEVAAQQGGNKEPHLLLRQRDVLAKGDLGVRSLANDEHHIDPGVAQRHQGNRAKPAQGRPRHSGSGNAKLLLLVEKQEESS
ncbi:hypothetical protein ZIOFF_058814 [Zingiber officinale]|uniref:Uncharacterized protein n=1 Tax=Zingiber officinale TaxID=94328 RepID=A0A8J5FA99_ZINOF|nr:hypothetical protein ZIOFF_058814 [Zingiber officinale]